MNQTKNLFTTGLIFLVLTSVSLAVDTIPWAPNLSAAMNMASRQNRLVLIHFWAPNCPPCRTLESNVFSLPQVGSSLATDFIPVKVNAQQMPETARRYKVDRWPTDVVVTPAGYMLHKSGCSQNPQEYVSLLKMVASRHKQSQSMITRSTQQQPFTATAPASNAAAMQQPTGTVNNSFSRQADPNPASVNQPGSRFSSYSNADSVAQNNRTQPANNPYFDRQPARQSPISPGYASQAAPAQNSFHNSYQTGRQQTNSYNTNQFQQSQVNNGQTSRWSQGSNSSPINHGNPRVAQAPNYQSGPPIGQSQNPTNNIPPSRQGLQNQSWSHNTQTQPPAVQHGEVQPPQQQFPSQRNVSPAAPSIFMDGYCPVTLVEKSTWTKGDARWGANHRGRTYLFTSAAEQARFLAAPDRYAPILSGNDAVRYLERGELVAGSRKHGVFYHNQVYLFADEASLERFWGSPEKYANTARQAMQPRGPQYSAPR